jgi:hypothetical protein
MLYYLPTGKITIKGEYAKSEQSPTPTTAPPTPTSKPDLTLGGNPDQRGENPGAGGEPITISGGQLKITVTSRVEADQKLACIT